MSAECFNMNFIQFKNGCERTVLIRFDEIQYIYSIDEYQHLTLKLIHKKRQIFEMTPKMFFQLVESIKCEAKK